jgi:hypothetical protein
VNPLHQSLIANITLLITTLWQVARADKQHYKVTIMSFNQYSKNEENENTIVETVNRDYDIRATCMATYPAQFSNIKQHFGAKISDQVHESLLRGRAIISTQQQAEQFLFSFGSMHEAKMKNACASLFPHLLKHGNSALEIIDYGCGQGLASVVLLNELQAVDFPVPQVASITLIEPSPVTLNRAVAFLKSMRVLRSRQCELDNLADSALSTQSKSVKVHLFSNILDMGDDAFNIEQLANTIKASQSGVNYFICVSPSINTHCNARIDRFASFFDSNNSELILSNHGPVRPDRNWGQKICVFKVTL